LASVSPPRRKSPGREQEVLDTRQVVGDLAVAVHSLHAVFEMVTHASSRTKRERDPTSPPRARLAVIAVDPAPGVAMTGCARTPEQDHDSRSSRYMRDSVRSARRRPSADRREASRDICRAECRSWSRILLMPGLGVPSHPQPLRSHLAPVFLLDLGVAPLSLQAAVFRVSSKFLRLGRPVHGSLAHPPAWQASVEANGSRVARASRKGRA
jgi:hypothetical protein